MKNKLFKILLLSIVLIASLMTTVMGASGLIGQVQPTTSDVTSSIIGAGNQVAGIVAAVGVSVALVILIWLGIKYMTAAPSDKADVKKSAVPFIIGAVILFAASGILGLIATFATEIGNSLS